MTDKISKNQLKQKSSETFDEIFEQHFFELENYRNELKKKQNELTSLKEEIETLKINIRQLKYLIAEKVNCFAKEKKIALKSKTEIITEISNASLEITNPKLIPVLLRKIDSFEIHKGRSLTTRVYNCLVALDVHYIYDLVQKSEDKLLKTRNFYINSLWRTKEFLNEIGLGLGMRISPEIQEILKEETRKIEETKRQNNQKKNDKEN